MGTEKLREKILPPNQNTVGICNQITFLTLYHISYRLVTLLKIIVAPIQDSDVFELTVSLKFIEFVFQIFLPFAAEVSTIFTSP